MVAVPEGTVGGTEEVVAVDIVEELEGGTVEIVREEQGKEGGGGGRTVQPEWNGNGFRWRGGVRFFGQH
jgi:hypothetical protein